MKIKNMITISIFIICIITISFFSSGGCGVDFGGGGSGGGGGGGGGGSNLPSIVQGTITSLPTSAVMARIVETTGSAIFDSNTIDTSGYFLIPGITTDGCLTLWLEFLDSSQNILAFTNITVFPNSNINLGSISLSQENGSVIPQGNINLTLQGITNFPATNNPPMTCSGGVNDSVGTIVITQNNTDIGVQINSNTAILDINSNPIGCDDLITNQNVQVTGTLQVNNTVLATLIKYTVQTATPTPTPTPEPTPTP